MIITKLIQNKQLLFAICKLGYLRNKLRLDNLRIYNNGRFFIYTVNGFSVASESFNWYLHKEVLIRDVLNVSCKFYHPRPGDIVVDIGAGMGEETSIYTDMVTAHGRVYAIEANPVVYNILKEISRLNGLDNVHHFNMALNDRIEPVNIDDIPGNYLSSSLGNLNAGESHEVKGMPLHDFCTTHNIHHIDFLKVNIEGAERFLADTFFNSELNIKNVAISCHDFRFLNENNDFFQTKSIVIDYLKDNNYEIKFQETGIPYIDDWVYGAKRK